MFMGDASTTTEYEILNKYNLPDIDVLKVGHHGSRTSSSKHFINKINPKYSIISVGENKFGHPSTHTLELLKPTTKVNTITVKKDNAIIIYVNENTKNSVTASFSGKTYTGIAKCHPSDWDFESKLVGQHYAYVRSMIHEMSVKRDELRTELKMLYHIQSLYNHSTKINKKSYECYLLRRQIKSKEREISHMRDIIRTAKANLRATIALKNKFYNSVREERKKKNGET